MYGPACAHANDAANLFPQEALLNGGIVDYILGAEPGPGVFVLAHSDDPIRQQYMNYFKMGDGPFYTFYTPYHLPHIKAPLTVASAALFGDPATAPNRHPVGQPLTVRQLAPPHPRAPGRVRSRDA